MEQLGRRSLSPAGTWQMRGSQRRGSESRASSTSSSCAHKARAWTRGVFRFPSRRRSGRRTAQGLFSHRRSRRGAHRREKVTGQSARVDRTLNETLPHLFALLGISSAGHRARGKDKSIGAAVRVRRSAASFCARAWNQPLSSSSKDLPLGRCGNGKRFLKLMADSLGTARITHDGELPP